MKLIKILLPILVLVPILGYLLLFTPAGNNLLTPMLKKEIDKTLHVNSTIENFVLTSNTFGLKFDITPNNSVQIVGNYAFFEEKFNAAYRLKLNNTTELEHLIGQPIVGNIHTDGKIEGYLHAFDVVGKSNIAHSNTHYNLHVEDKQVTQIHSSIKSIKGEELLAMLSQKSYAKGAIDANISLNIQNIQHPLGTISFQIDEGHIDTVLMKKDFNVTLDETTFSTNTTIQLGKNSSKVDSTFSSSLANFTLEARMNKEKRIEAKSRGIIKELALLEPFVHYPLRGEVDFNATLKGNERNALLHVETTLADSYSIFESKLHAFKPSTLSADINHLHVDKLLYTLNQNSYLKQATLNSTIYINDIDKLRGTIELDILDAQINPLAIERSTQLKNIPDADFNLSLHTTLLNNIVQSSLHVTSSLFALSTEKTSYNLLNEEFSSDFIFKNIELSKFKFLTNRDLQSKMDLIGSMSDTPHLKVEARSYFCDGELNLSLNNRDLHVKATNLDSLKLLHTLTYPTYFQSRLSAEIDYNLRHKRGLINATIENGRFTRNSIFEAVLNYTETNLYKERFKGTLHSNIENDILINDIELLSDNSSMITKKSYLNVRSKQTNTTLHVIANKNPIDFHIKGSINQPQVTIDASKLVEKEVGNLLSNLLN